MIGFSDNQCGGRDLGLVWEGVELWQISGWPRGIYSFLFIEKMVSIGARIEGVLTVNCSSVVNRPVFCSHDLPFGYHTTGAGLNLDRRH